MARRPIATTIATSGPFFTRDPQKTFRQNARAMLAELAEQGEQDVKAQLLQGQPSRAPLAYVTPNRVSAHVVGRVNSLAGKPWALNAVVSVDASGLDRQSAIALMAGASVIEGRSGVFKRTAARLRRSSKVNAAELLKGIA